MRLIPDSIGKLCASLLAATAFLSGQVLTYHYDTARTGVTQTETVLTTGNVNTASFGKLFSLPVDGQIYSQPLYLPNVTIPQKGVHNVVYVATQNNSVYAFDADALGSALWQVNLGPPMQQYVCCLPKDILPQIGITSTPVIDPAANLLYVVAETYENQETIFRLHALDITTGKDRLTPAVIQGSVPGSSSDSRNGVLAFAPFWHWQRPGLLLLNGNLYIGFGSHGDLNPYHGWLFAYNAATLQQTGVLSLAPGSQGNGLWQGGVGLTADDQGYVYLETGNGLLSANTGGQDFGDSVVKVGMLTGSAGGLTVLDYFSPSTQAKLAQDDLDLGSSGVVMIPGTSMAVAGGKDGKIYLLNTSYLGGFDTGAGGTDGLLQEWQATYATSYTPSTPGGFWGGNYLFYNSELYTFGERDSLRTFALNGTQFDTVPRAQSSIIAPSGLSNDPAMSISANAAIPGTGVVWAAFASNGIADGSAQPGEFHAFDASDVSKELWNSTQNANRDNSGTYAKWSPPIVANGKVYLASFDNALSVFGLLSNGRTISIAGGNGQTVTVNTALGTALQVFVRDANNNPLGGVAVTLTAPASGASATFVGGAVSATVNSDVNGLAVSPALTANGRAGAYSISAAAAGASPVFFSLVNKGGVPASIAAMGGGNQSGIIYNLFANPLRALVNDANGNAVAGITVTFSAPSSAPTGTFAGSATATAVTDSTGTAIAPPLTAGSSTGVYNIAAGVVGVPTSAAFALTNTTATSGSLSATRNNATTPVNLTAEGASDWVHWSTAGLLRKSGVTPQISNYTLQSAGSAQGYANDPRLLSWTDATPTSSGSGSGLTLNAVQNGFLLTAPADTVTRILVVHAGGSSSSGTLRAHLSDGSASDFVNTTTLVSGLYDVNYTLTYRAASAGQTMTVSWANSSNVGSINLSGAALSIAGPTLAATSGTPQNASVNTIFATALQTTLTSSNGNPLSGVQVTFAAPANGATGTFSNAGTAVAMTDSSGVATAPAFTAGSQKGTYNVTATAAGLNTPATFVLANVAAIITTAGGTPQSAPVNTAFPAFLRVIVTDVGNAPLSGATVTFIAPVNGATGSFGGAFTATAVTDASGAAIAPVFTAGPVTGSYTITATAVGASAPANFSLSNTIGGGALSGSTTSSAATVNLTGEGTLDWVHWGNGMTTRKSGVTAQISGYSVVGSGPVLAYGNDPRALSWTDGTAVASGSDNQGVYLNFIQNGFSFTVPADTSSRVAIVHVGGYSSSGTLTAHLSDGSATDFVDVTTAVGGAYDRNYTLSYRALSAGQTLIVSWINTSGAGNVTLNGAALTLPGLSIVNSGPSSQIATINTAFTTPLQATVTNAGSPAGGVTVTFSAPASGATGTFSGAGTATAVSNASGVATAPGFTAGGQTGSYVVSASVVGAGSPATYNLTNTASGGLVSGSGTSVASTVNLTGEGTLDWVHWGNGTTTRKSGVTAQIGNYAVVGGGAVMSYSNDPRLLSWTDGTPVAAGSDGHGVYVNFLQNGFLFTVPADTTARALLVHVGGYASGGTLTAHLSDGSAADYVDVTAAVGGAYDRNYTVTYHAVSAGQTLTVSWINTSGSGNVTLNGAALTLAGPAVGATAGTPQSTIVNTSFSTPLQATVTNAGSPAGGVTVTFSAPASGATGTFSGAGTATAVSNASGVATAPGFTAGGQTGSYVVSASVVGAGSPATYNLTNTASGGVVSGSGTSVASTVNLTGEGTLDWVHWGNGTTTRKSGVTAQIGNYAVVGGGAVMSYSNDPRLLSWTDGTPVAAGSDGQGVYVNFLQNGFLFTVPADTTARALLVHVGGYASGGTLTAHLSDGSAADYVDVTAAVGGAYDRNYTVTYHAVSAGQTLTVSWINTSGSGNVTLNGAALTLAGPAVGATAGTPQSTIVNTSFSTPLQATVTNAGSPAGGVTVTFSAPASGATGTFSGAGTATAVSNASGVATAPGFTAGGQTGSYVVSASVVGAGSPATYNLTNTASGGVVSGSGTSVASTVNLTGEGTLDWVHWGNGTTTRKSGVTAQIGNYAVVGGGAVMSYSNDPRLLSWTDGTPVAAGSDGQGLYVNFLQNGFLFTVPADTTARALLVHVGGYASGGTLTAHLSDGSAADYVDVTAAVGGAYDRNYTVTYHAVSAGQTLIVSWINTSGSGNVTLNGAALQ